MPLLIGCLALLFPRVALVLLWLFGGGYIGRAYEHWIFPFIGFFVLPLTTLAFAFGMNSLGAPGSMPPLGWLLVGLAVLADIGLLRGGERGTKEWRSKRADDG